MGGDGTRLAVAILVFFLAMLAFFFAFHPGGVEGVSDPATMLQWLMKQWDATSQGAPPAAEIPQSVPVQGGGTLTQGGANA